MDWVVQSESGVNASCFLLIVTVIEARQEFVNGHVMGNFVNKFFECECLSIFILVQVFDCD